MNTSPTAKTVLCFGDSLTNGAKPDRTGRFAANERWTGVLQDKLGDNYYVIEEGLGGRTTDLEHHNEKKPGRNGLSYFKACIGSHQPLSTIIIMLGSNDLKTIFNRTPADIATALKQYPDFVREYCKQADVKLPEIILVSPSYMDDTAPKFTESMPTPGIYDAGSVEKSRQLAIPIQRVAEQTGCTFLDAATVTQTGEDGCHIDQDSHTRLAHSLYDLMCK